MPIIRSLELEEFAGALLISGGASAAEAAVVARSLIGANLRGHDSHGVMRIPYYVEFVREGRMHPGVELKVLRETASVLACDAGWGFGQVQAQRLLARLVPKAKETGVACGTLSRSGHIGRVGEIGAAAGLATIAVVNTHGAAQRVAPPGGKRPLLGTNPLCIGVPTSAEPIVLDFGTSAVAEGKVRSYRIAGKSCPPGWLLDPDGKPTTDPNQLYGDPPGSLLPMGGAQAYKGFGLGLVIDMLAGGLSGGWCSRPKPEPPLGNDAVFVLLDPSHFGGMEHFLREVTGVASYIRSCPTAEGVEEILLPGDPERRALAERSRNGIPIDDGNWRQLTALADRLGVSVPADGTRTHH
jgi:LDH2 family malate/lactate/ureidoglycolate dehydrogenase